MVRLGEVPREQWRSRSKKSANVRKHKMKQSILSKNLEKVENLQYKQERQERDRMRVSQGDQPAGHHNLPQELLQRKVKEAAPAPVGKTAPLFPKGHLIGILRPEIVRKRLQSMYDVEKQ